MLREQNPTEDALSPKRNFLFVHAGSDFDALDSRFLGKGEGYGGFQIRPLGKGFYGYLVRDEEEAERAVQYARAYLKHAPTKQRAIHAFNVELKAGDVHFGSVWDEALLTKADRERRKEWNDANALAPGPERIAAYEALQAKYSQGLNKRDLPFRTEVLGGIGLIEIAANDLTRLNRAGKWSPETSDEKIVSQLREMVALNRALNDAQRAPVKMDAHEADLEEVTRRNRMEAAIKAQDYLQSVPSKKPTLTP